MAIVTNDRAPTPDEIILNPSNCFISQLFWLNVKKIYLLEYGNLMTESG